MSPAEQKALLLMSECDHYGEPAGLSVAELLRWHIQQATASLDWFERGRRPAYDAAIAQTKDWLDAANKVLAEL